MEHKKHNFIWFLIVFSFIGTQCRPVPSGNNPTITSLSSSFPFTSIPPTQTALLTSTPTPTEKPTRMPTWTAVATLPPDQAQSLLADLVATNGGCVYPCWWSIVPGETSWAAARDFLQPLASKTYIGKKGNYYDLTFPNSEGDSAGFTVEDGVVNLINTRNGKNIFVMLEEFGKPDQIWINAKDRGTPGPARYDLVLFYSEKGIMAYYDGPAPESEDGSIVEICLEESLSEPYYPLWLWSPESNKTYRELESLYIVGQLPGPTAFFVSLEESAEIDVDTFFEIYIDPAKRSTCFEAIDRTQITPEPTP